MALKIKFILKESMVTVQNLPSNIFIQISKNKSIPGSYIVRYVSRQKEPLSDFDKHYPKLSDNKPSGHVIFGPTQVFHDSPGHVCEGVWEVADSVAWPGYGPLLYDIAIEIASKYGKGLTSDRNTVSSNAQKIWDYYLNNRRDIKHSQLDNPENELTVTTADNCIQRRAKKDGDWVKSSLSKVYSRKAQPTIDALRRANKLFWDL